MNYKTWEDFNVAKGSMVNITLARLDNGSTLLEINGADSIPLTDPDQLAALINSLQDIHQDLLENEAREKS